MAYGGHLYFVGITTVNILLNWLSTALATVQANLVFTPYLNHKNQQERNLEWTEVGHPTALVKTEKWIQAFCST